MQIISQKKDAAYARLHKYWTPERIAELAEKHASRTRRERGALKME